MREKRENPHPTHNTEAMAEEAAPKTEEVDIRRNFNYPLVVKTDMNEEMLAECTETAQTAIEKHSKSNEDAANMLKEIMDKKFGAPWYVDKTGFLQLVFALTKEQSTSSHRHKLYAHRHKQTQTHTHKHTNTHKHTHSQTHTHTTLTHKHKCKHKCKHTQMQTQMQTLQERDYWRSIWIRGHASNVKSALHVLWWKLGRVGLEVPVSWTGVIVSSTHAPPLLCSLAFAFVQPALVAFDISAC